TRRFTQVAQSRVRATWYRMPGGLTALSTDLQTSVVWAVLPGGNADGVYAFDAGDLTELWSADLPADHPRIGHHAAPTIGGGKLFVATATGGIVVYGRGPAAARAPPAPAPRPSAPPLVQRGVTFPNERAVRAAPIALRNQVTPAEC